MKKLVVLIALLSASGRSHTLVSDLPPGLCNESFQNNQFWRAPSGDEECGVKGLP